MTVLTSVVEINYYFPWIFHPVLIGSPSLRPLHPRCLFSTASLMYFCSSGLFSVRPNHSNHKNISFRFRFSLFLAPIYVSNNMYYFVMNKVLTESVYMYWTIGKFNYNSQDFICDPAGMPSYFLLKNRIS